MGYNLPTSIFERKSFLFKKNLCTCPAFELNEKNKIVKNIFAELVVDWVRQAG